MCSSSSSSSLDKFLMEIDIDAVVGELTEAHIEDSPPSSPQNQKNYFLILPTELLEKIFTAFKLNDHDAFQNMSFTSKHMHFIVKPYLMKIRKELLDEFCGFKLRFNLPILDTCEDYVVHFCGEYLKRVLRTNMELICRAHNLPIEQVQQQAHASAASSADVQGRASSSSAAAAGEQAHALPTSGFIKLNSPFFMLGGSDDHLGAEQRAYQLFQILLKHHSEFSNFFKHIDVLATEMMKGKEGLHTNESNTKAFKAGFAYRIFKEFLHENPVLSMFTDVHWPEEMPEGARRQMAMQYAKEIVKNAPENGNPRKDLKYRIRIKGGLGNPSRPLQIHHCFQQKVAANNPCLPL